jgi:pyruvate carboxylase subunit B
VKYHVRVNGVEHVVEIDPNAPLSAKTFKLSVDDKPRELEYRTIDLLGQVLVRDGDASHGVSIESESTGSDVTVTIAGHAYRVRIEDERERAANAAERSSSKSGGVVESIMSGVVVDILVATGDSVTEGQPLLILEAMKMQNEIAAPSDGVVGEIYAAKGDAVNAGEKLLTIDVTVSGE